MKRLTLLAAAAALWLAGCASVPPGTSAESAAPASQPPATLVAQTGDIHHYRLGNGMEVIVKPDRRAPTAIQMIWVRTGSIDEVDGTSGIAHMLEHMMFKGTPSLPPGEFSRRVAALGGQENAFTSRDYTGYFQQVPAQRLADVMQLEADRLAHNQWPDEEFLREREVVTEERRARIDDQPRARLFEQMFASAFLADPARRPIIGWMADIAAYTPQDVRDFYQKWYVPGNMALVVVGQVEPEQVLALAQQHYGAIPARALPERKPFVEPAQQGERRLQLHDRAEQHLLTLAYKVPLLRNLQTPDAQDRDALALMLLSTILDGYDGARLERALTRGGKRLADSVGSSAMVTGRSGGLFVLTGIPARGISPTRLEQGLQAEIRRIARSGVSEAELQRVLTQWTASEVYAQDSLYAQASALGQAWIQKDPLNRTEMLVQQLRTITPRDVQRVAQQYFQPEQLTVATLVPKKPDANRAPAPKGKP